MDKKESATYCGFLFILCADCIIYGRKTDILNESANKYRKNAVITIHKIRRGGNIKNRERKSG